MESLKLILLVDDDDITNFINLRLLTNLKTSKRIEVRKSGRDALSYMEECKYFGNMYPDLILLDINMPGMDAAEFLELFDKLNLRNGDQTKIVFLSTCKNPQDEQLCSKYDVYNHLIKPLTKDKLNSLLSEMHCMH